MAFAATAPTIEAFGVMDAERPPLSRRAGRPPSSSSWIFPRGAAAFAGGRRRPMRALRRAAVPSTPAPLALLFALLFSLHGVADAASLLLRGGRSRQAQAPPVNVVNDLDADGIPDVDMNGDGVQDIDMNADGVPDEDLNADGVPDKSSDDLLGFPLSPTQDPALVITTTVLPTFAPQPGATDTSAVEDWRANDKSALLGSVPCDCANCTGKIYTADNRPGAKGFQCKPNANGMAGGTCKQVGNPADWVVQTRPDITYERFCLYTCKPLVPKRITLEIPCAPLDKWERTLEAQTPSGNGREFVFRANPMTQAVPWPALPTEEVEAPKDPVAQLVATFARYSSPAKKGSAPPEGDGLCECPCDESPLDAMKKQMQDVMEWDAMVSPGALYPTPPPTAPPGPPPPDPHVVPPPMPPPPPPGPAAVAPLPALPMNFPLPSLVAPPTLEPPPMPTWMPTPPPPAMPPPPEDAVPPHVAMANAAAAMQSIAGAAPSVPQATALADLSDFSVMQMPQAPPPPPPPAPAAFFSLGAAGLPQPYWEVPAALPAPPVGAGQFAPAMPPLQYGMQIATDAAGLESWGQPPSFLQEEHRPMRFTRPGGMVQQLPPPKRSQCPAEQCRTRCSQRQAAKEREAAMWEAERNAVQKARLRSLRVAPQDDPEEDDGA